jgi:raffinose/stachyose/melibiose transport system permease protein
MTSRRVTILKGLGQRLGQLVPHSILIFFSLLCVFPVVLVIFNSFKTNAALFSTPLQLPNAATFTLGGYVTVAAHADFIEYFRNSLIVTVGSLIFILLFGSMAGYALAEYKFTGHKILGFYLIIGLMIPIRLGTVSIVRIMVSLGLINTLTALILVYTASGLPIAIFILQQFMYQVPQELKDAARVDGASEYHIFWLILPLVRPAIATVAVFTMIPTWSDLWFPLILAPSNATRTVTLGAQMFIGQYHTDWTGLMAALTLSMVPVLVMYLLFSRQLISGLTAGAFK